MFTGFDREIPFVYSFQMSHAMSQKIKINLDIQLMFLKSKYFLFERAEDMDYERKIKKKNSFGNFLGGLVFYKDLAMRELTKARVPWVLSGPKITRSRGMPEYQRESSLG